MNKAKPPVLRIPGASCLVLTALAHQAVKPLAEIVCNYFCCNGDDRRQRRKQGGVVGAAGRNPYRMPEGPQCQYNTSSDTIQQKATAYDHTVPAAAFLFFLPSTAFFVDKGPACYYNNVVKMALLCGFAAVQNK